MRDRRGDQRRGQTSSDPENGEGLIVTEEKRGLWRDRIAAEGLRERNRELEIGEGNIADKVKKENTTKEIYHLYYIFPTEKNAGG